jgi:hypothetical protein
MPEASARGKLARSIPLLRDAPQRLSLDPGSMRDLLIRLARALEKK